MAEWPGLFSFINTLPIGLVCLIQVYTEQLYLDVRGGCVKRVKLWEKNQRYLELSRQLVLKHWSNHYPLSSFIVPWEPQAQHEIHRILPPAFTTCCSHLYSKTFHSRANAYKRTLKRRNSVSISSLCYKVLPGISHYKLLLEESYRLLHSISQLTPCLATDARTREPLYLY